MPERNDFGTPRPGPLSRMRSWRGVVDSIALVSGFVQNPLGFLGLAADNNPWIRRQERRMLESRETRGPAPIAATGPRTEAVGNAEHEVSDGNDIREDSVRTGRRVDGLPG